MSNVVVIGMLHNVVVGHRLWAMQQTGMKSIALIPIAHLLALLDALHVQEHVGSYVFVGVVSNRKNFMEALDAVGGRRPLDRAKSLCLSGDCEKNSNKNNLSIEGHGEVVVAMCSL